MVTTLNKSNRKLSINEEDEEISSQNVNKRIEKWDLLRALLIFLVVLGHLADEYTSSSKNMRALYLFIYTFHMPCFLFLSGLFSKKNIQERRYRRIFSYVIIYLFISILFSVVSGFVNHTITFSLFSGNGIAWYGLCLFWCSLLTILLSKFPQKWVLIASIILACMIGYDGNIGNTLALSRTIVFYPFFFLGYCLDQEKVAKKLSSPMIRACAVLFLAVLAVVCLSQVDSVYFLRPLFTGRNPYKVLPDNMVVYGGLLRFICYAISAAGCISIISLIPNHLPHSRAIQAVGEHSLEIYILHSPAIYILYNGFSFASLVAKWGGWIILPLALVLTIVFALPFWAKPIRAIIYPQILDQDSEIRLRRRHENNTDT